MSQTLDTAIAIYLAWFSPTGSCDGIGQGSGPIGAAGNPAVGRADPRLAVSFATSSDG